MDRNRVDFVRGLLSPAEAYGSPESQPARMNPAIARRSEIAARLMSPPTSVMDERYPAWKKSQDQAEQFLLAADFVSSAIPAAVMAAPYAKKGLLAAGKTIAPQIENYMAKTGLLQPATVWHGSPHRFDKFDASKIGTGEGAQAYGHGLYLAENPKVAKEYSKMQPSSLVPPNRIFQGRELTPGTPEYHAGTLLERSTLPAARKEVSRWIAEGSPDPKVLDGWRKTLDTLNAAKSKADFKVGSNANLYKVDLPDEAIAKMLDWDKPLSQQPEVVRKALEPLVAPIRAEMAKPAGAGWGDLAAPQKYDPPGSELLQLLAKDKSMSAQNVLSGGVGPDASSRARSMGIPGIRYLDGGSRGTGAGTSNYVVFPGNESLLKILSRE